MTTTEVIDPHAAVVAGTSIVEHGGWNIEGQRLWTTRTGGHYTWCGEIGGDGYPCSREQGHPVEWSHIACDTVNDGARGHVRAVWPSTPLIPDPITVQVGHDYYACGGSGVANHAESGIWTQRNYTWCGVPGPATGHICSRPTGHPTHWNHVAAFSTNGAPSGMTVTEIWGGAAVPPLEEARNSDPLRDIVIGARESVVTDTADAIIYTDDSAKWCGAANPDGSFGICSRPAGHHVGWRHIAANANYVLSVWETIPPKFDDPFGSVRVDQWVGDFNDYSNPVHGIRVADGLRCSYQRPNGASRGCTRPKDHFGSHIGTNSDRIMWIMPNSKIWNPVGDIPPIDPEDGSPRDVETLIYREMPPIGSVVKLRDRNRLLYVITQRRGSAEVEALDLSDNTLRAVPVQRCVHQDAPLTEAQLTQVAQWYHGHREAVKKVAVREYRNGRWCMAGLNENLAELGLEQYEPKLSGWISVKIPFEHEDVSVGQSTVEGLVNKALEDPQVMIALRLALPTIDQIELDSSGMKVLAHDFSRK